MQFLRTQSGHRLAQDRPEHGGPPAAGTTDDQPGAALREVESQWLLGLDVGAVDEPDGEQGPIPIGDRGALVERGRSDPVRERRSPRAVRSRRSRGVGVPADGAAQPGEIAVAGGREWLGCGAFR